VPEARAPFILSASRMHCIRRKSYRIVVLIAHVLSLMAAYAAILIAAAWGLGVNAALIKDELKILRKFVGR